LSGRTDIFKPATKPYWVSQRERAATRDVLIGVARDLVERDGVPALTLGAVADQAGMARATVYGFFSGRSELLRALERKLPAPEPQAAPETDGMADSDSSSAIWINCQPDLNDFLPEEASPEEEGAKEPPPAQEAEPAAVVPDRQSTQPPAEADTSEDWVVFEAPEPEAAAAQSQPTESAPDAEPEAQSHAAVAAEPVEESQPAASDAEAAVRDEPAEEGDAASAAFQSDQAAAEVSAPSAEEPEPVARATQQAQAGPAEEHLDILAGQEERRRQQAAHLDEIAKRLILPESAIRDGTDAVIARLDTRIRVLEKSIAGLETRQNTAEADGGRKIKPVAEKVEQLFARTDGADAKQLKSVSELRLSIHHLETRLEALEAPHRVAASGAQAWAEPAPQPEPPPEIAAPETADAQATPSDDDEGQPENPKHAYLSAVRSLAKEGARQAAERETMFEEERLTRRRRMMVAAGVAVVCLGVIGVLFVFRPGSHGVSIAQSKPNPAAIHATRSSVRTALAPLDRLSALAQKGDSEAELLVGLKYLEGGGNDALAARWLGRASDQGNAVAENALGALYQNGRGVSADPAKATHLYESAAAQGNRHAMSNLAVLYAGANDKMKDFTEAARWFQRSASLGYVDAQFNLAVLYERGDGVPQSLLDAYKWYTIAAAAGDAVAKTRADAIATQISPDELAAAQKAVVDFKPLALNKKTNDVPSMPEVLAAK
jgi:TPR repeat protein/AcrR family transcriptional regulator